MKKLLKELNKWNLRNDIKLSKWQREVLYNFLTEHIKEVKKNG